MATIIINPIKATFIHIPKTGGNSITTWLRDHTDSRITKKMQHARLQEVIDRDQHVLGPQKREDLGFVFCVVRNPWDYMVSWYTFEKMLIEERIKFVKEYPDPATRRKAKWKSYNLEDLEKKLEYFNKGFENWLPNSKYDTQHSWAKDCDAVFRLENINEDFKIIQQKVNCFEPLQTLNKTKNRKTYQTYYTSQELIDFVADKYKVDIDTYGYDF